MSSVCLSLVANLRCSGLLPNQAVGILIPPIFEAVFISFLLYTQRGKERKHFLLVLDSTIYLILCILDYTSKAVNSIARSLRSFSLLDRLIGGFSALPIILFTLFLYLFARQHLIPIVPVRFHSGLKVLFLLLIPILLTLVELGSFLGIAYGRLASPSRELVIRFDTPLSKTVWTLFNSAGLAIFILYHLLTFLLSCFRIFRHFLQSSSSSDSSHPRGEKRRRQGSKKDERNKDDHDNKKTLKGLGWFAAGVKLSAFEVLLGYIPNGFEMSLSRRLLRLLGRAMIAWGLYKGLDETASLVLFRISSIDSIEGLPPRRIPVNPDRSIRDLIGAPITTTFAHMSPTATAFHTRKNAPDAMRGASQYTKSFFIADEENEKASAVGGGGGFGSGGSGLRRGGPAGVSTGGNEAGRTMEALQSTVVPALLVQNVAAPATNNATFPDQVTRTVDPTIPPTSTNSNSTRTADLKGKRVTLAYDGLAAPTLDIRFSSQAFPDANLLIRRLGKHSPSASTDGSHSHSGNSHPGISRSKTTVGIATVVPSVSPFADPAVDYPFPLPKMGRGRSRSLSQKSSTPGSGPELHNPFADSYEILFPRGAGILSPGGSAEDGSMEGSLMAIHQLSKKFPGLPPGVVPVRPEELFANGGGGGRRRSKSMSNAAVGVAKRKPPPPVLVEESETMSTTKSTRSPTLVQQQQGRLTKSRPRSRSQPPAPIPNRTTASNRYSDEMVQMDDELGNASRPAGQLSPTASLDQDVATRTRRRIRNHLSTVEPASASARSSAAGITGDNETQWAMVPQLSTLNGVATRDRTKSSGSLQNRTVVTNTSTTTPSSLFSAPMNGIQQRETRGDQSSRMPRRRNTEEGNTVDVGSPLTVYTRESEYSVRMEGDDEVAPPLVVGRPTGRIARRALGIERFLGEEKEKWEASQDGHGPATTTVPTMTVPHLYASVLPSSHAPGVGLGGEGGASGVRASVPEDVTDIADYRASNMVISPPNTSRRRPRSDVDTLRNPIPSVFAGEQRSVGPKKKDGNNNGGNREGSSTPTSSGTYPTTATSRGLKRSVTTVDDPEARRAFAAAWKTVEPKIASPTIAGLRNMGSVSVKRTPPPMVQKLMLTRQSVYGDEGNVEEEESLTLPPLLLQSAQTQSIMTGPVSNNDVGFGRMRGSVING